MKTNQLLLKAGLLPICWYVTNDKSYSTNSSGFSALPGGSYDMNLEKYAYIKHGGTWWSSTPSTYSNKFYTFDMHCQTLGLHKESRNGKQRYSVGCIKDKQTNKQTNKLNVRNNRRILIRVCP